MERLLEILSISNGKALVLFTAKTDMEEVYSILSEKNLPYKILMQQPGSSQDKVLNEFTKDWLRPSSKPIIRIGGISAPIATGGKGRADHPDFPLSFIK